MFGNNRGLRLILYTIIPPVYMSDESVQFLPYTATSLSVVGRGIFMFLLYRNKSTNSLSLLFCVLNMGSASMWLYYSMQKDDIPMVVRSSTELALLFFSAAYIIRNKMIDQQHPVPPHQLLPT
jgi:hypothetical protein